MMRFTPLFLLVILSVFSAHCETKKSEDLSTHLQGKAITLEKTDHLKPALAQASDKKMVLLGEASHGTHEYYTWRDSISRFLIEEHGFNFIAVEGDWASLYELNRYVKNLPGAASSASEVLTELTRWPTWMWGNKEVEGLAEWLRSYNDNRPESKRVGFYGMDVYDEWRSIQTLHDFFSQRNPDFFHTEIEKHLSCFDRFSGDSHFYARYLAGGGKSCAEESQALVLALLNNRDALSSLSDYEYFYALQNAYVIQYAEKFFRYSATTRDASSWNSRVEHMQLTTERLLELYGNDAKGIAWAHNTHVGDARYTDMQRWNRKNIGQLSREKWGDDKVLIVGFGTYQGRVKAGLNWGGSRINSEVPPAPEGSIEHAMHQTGIPAFYLLFDDEDKKHSKLSQPIGNRAIGVVYNHLHDHRQNYVSTIMPLRYDVFIFFQETQALSPLHE